MLLDGPVPLAPYQRSTLEGGNACFNSPPRLTVAFAPFLPSSCSKAPVSCVDSGYLDLPWSGFGNRDPGESPPGLNCTFFPLLPKLRQTSPIPASLGAFPEQSPAGSGPLGKERHLLEDKGRCLLVTLAATTSLLALDVGFPLDGAFPLHTTHHPILTLRSGSEPEASHTNPFLANPSRICCFAFSSDARVKHEEMVRQRQVNPCCMLGAGRQRRLRELYPHISAI